MSHPYFKRGGHWVVWRWQAKASHYRSYAPPNSLVSEPQRRSAFRSCLCASYGDLAGPTWPFVGDSPLKHPYVLTVAFLRVTWSFDGLIFEKKNLGVRCVGKNKKKIMKNRKSEAKRMKKKEEECRSLF